VTKRRRGRRREEEEKEDEKGSDVEGEKKRAPQRFKSWRHLHETVHGLGLNV